MYGPNQARLSPDQHAVVIRQFREQSRDICSLYLTQAECLGRIRCTYDPSQAVVPHCDSDESVNAKRTCARLP